MRKWRALLDTGPTATAAKEVLTDIAIAEMKAPIPWDASLPSGSAGMAIFLARYGDAFGDANAKLRGMDLLDQAIDAVAGRRMSPALHGGFTGIGWAVEHLSDLDGESDRAAAVDGALRALLTREGWFDYYDLIGGLVGFGVYALKRLPAPEAALCLELVVGHLERLAEPRVDGVTWHTRAELLPAWQRRVSPAGHFNLGMAHGVPGVIAMLARTAAAGIAADRARHLAEAGAEWLVAQRLPAGGVGWFANYSGGGGSHAAARLAWCYGDLGIAVALLIVGRSLNSERWTREALDLAVAAAARPMDKSGVLDPGLCHGAFGNAHLFNRLYQATGHERLRTCAIDWLRHGLAMRRPGFGMAGFLARTVDLDGTVQWGADPGFLTGTAGIGLALMAACTDHEPTWDSCLLADVSLTTGRTQSDGRQNVPGVARLP